MKKDYLLEVAEIIRKLGREVRNNLGGGFKEEIYQNALAIEFRKNKIEYLKEVNIEIFYKGESVGCDRPDFIITKIGKYNKPIVLELKVTDRLTDDNRLQLKSYCTSLPRNKTPVLNGFGGGILMAFPKNEIKKDADIKLVVVDASFKILLDEQAVEEQKKKNKK